MRLRPKITLAVLAPLLVGIAIIVIVTLVLVGLLNSFTGSQSGNDIQTYTLALLDESAMSKAGLIDEYIATLSATTSVIGYFGNQYLAGVFTSSGLPSYCSLASIPPPSPLLPLVLTPDIYGIPVSTVASGWYEQGIVNTADVTPLVSQESNETSVFDIPFIATTGANPNYVYAQMGLEDSGFFRIFPYENLYSDLSRTAICLLDNLTRVGYDPRCRPWFFAAQAIPGVTSLTAPYLTSTPGLGLVIAAAHGLYVNSSFVGAVSLNLVVAGLEQAIITTTILENGYAFVIDSSGNLIFHHSVTDHTVTVTLAQAEFQNSVTDFSNFQTIENQMRAGTVGNSSYYKAGEKWWISWYPAPKAGYSLAVVVPDSDIQAPVQEFQSHLITLLIVQLVVFVGVMLIVSFAFWFAVSRLVSRIVLPIKELTSLCEQIAKGDLEKDLDELETSSKEISEIYRTFGALLNALRFGNEEYYKGDKKKAMRNYKHALEMFKSLNNEKAMGVCYNNIGNVYRDEGNFEEAEKAYLSAIEVGIKLNDPPTIETQQALASRYNNLAMLYLYLGRMRNKAERPKSSFSNSFVSEDRENPRSCRDMAQIEEIPHQSFADKKAAEHVAEVRAVFDEARLNPTLLKGKTVRPKDIFFLLDYSGSMAGSKNKASLKGIKSIINEQVNANDNICLVTFNAASNVVIPLQPKGINEAAIQNQVEFLTYPNGGTAFFDALGDAYDYIAKANQDRDQWIIALTDGDDNQSKRFSPGKVKSLVAAYPLATVVIISVGELTSRDILESITKASNNGLLLDVKDSGNAITQAFQEIATLLQAKVETYNFKYDL